MSRLFDAVSNSRAIAPLPMREVPALPAVDLPLLRLWQAVEARFGGRVPKVIQVAPVAAAEADPMVAMGLARLVGGSDRRGVVLLDPVRRRLAVEGGVAFGPLPGRLAPDSLRRLWQRLGERAGLIVLDSPPVLTSPVAMALAPTVDGVILVVEAERTRHAVAAAARDALLKAGAEVLGVVLNRRRFHVPKGIYDRL